MALTPEEFNALPVAQVVTKENFDSIPVAVDESNFDAIPVHTKVNDVLKYGVEQLGVGSGNLLDLANKVQPINVGLQALGLKTPSSYSFTDIARQPDIEKKALTEAPVASQVVGGLTSSIPLAALGGIGPVAGTVKGQALIGGLTGLASNIQESPVKQAVGTGAGLGLGALLGKITGAPSTPEQVIQQSQAADIQARAPQLFEDVNKPGVAYDVEQKVINALKEAAPIRGEQENLYTAERAKRFAAAQEAGTGLEGESQYHAQLAQLGGTLPNAQYEPIRQQLNTDDITYLFNKVANAPGFSFTDTLTARKGLASLLGEEGTKVPTEGELQLLGEVFKPEMIQALLDKRTTGQKILAEAIDVSNLPRAFMASVDVSAPFRQGIFIGPSHPKEFAVAMRDMFKYAWDEKAYEGLSEELLKRPNYPLMRQTKLALTTLNEKFLTNREEGFMSRLAEKIPIVGTHLIRGSNRAYSGFLTKLRADVFDSEYATLKESYGGKVPASVVQSLTDFINAATGRGSLGSLNKAAPILNGLFFSPRLIASRIQLLNPVYYATLPQGVRKAAIKSLLAFTSAGLGVMGLAKLGGAKVEDDPRSADFGKIRVGNTRYDVWGGFQQYAVLASRLISGQTKSTMSGQVKTLGQGFKADTRWDVLQRFFQQKMAPIPAFAKGLLSGKDAIGRPFNVPKEVGTMFVPMAIQDTKDVVKDRGWQGAPMALPVYFGVGIQTYKKGSK